MELRRYGIGALALALATALASCGPEPPREFGKIDVEAINAMATEFVSAYNAKDAEKVANMFSGSGIIMPANASTLRGFEPIRGYFQTRFDEGASDLELETKDVSGHGPLAYVAGAYTLHLKPEDGSDTKDRGKFLWITRNLGGQWKLEVHSWSSDFPPPVPPPVPEEEAAKKK